jgi:hypothetical protein
MSEETWHESGDVRAMFNVAAYRLDERKRRLFAGACCRRVWELLPDIRSRRAVEAIEQFADGHFTREQLTSAAADAWTARRDAPSEASRTAGLAIRYAAAPDATFGREETAARDAAYAVGEARGLEARESERAVQAALLRCIAGPLLFRPVTFAPGWRTSAAVALAASMYESRDFAHMPVLADALEEAGCDAADVLGHCRGPGPHVRGCWVVDLVLGKT